MLLDSFAASQAKVAPYVEDLPLIEDALVKNGAVKALATYSAAEQNMKQVTDLSAYAGRR
jgi:hypothetical protein